MNLVGQECELDKSVNHMFYFREASEHVKHHESKWGATKAPALLGVKPQALMVRLWMYPESCSYPESNRS